MREPNADPIGKCSSGRASLQQHMRFVLGPNHPGGIAGRHGLGIELAVGHQRGCFRSWIRGLGDPDHRTRVFDRCHAAGDERTIAGDTQAPTTGPNGDQSVGAAKDIVAVDEADDERADRTLEHIRGDPT